jgi:hypothetical protein
MRLTVLPAKARTPADLEKAISAVAQGKAGALIVVRDGVFVAARSRNSRRRITC